MKNKTKQVKTNGTVDRGITEPAELAEPTKPRQMTVFIANGFRGIRFEIKKKRDITISSVTMKFTLRFVKFSFWLGLDEISALNIS